ncbi:hypothetical protein PAMP_020682 [Pampus punctatissimus]
MEDYDRFVHNRLAQLGKSQEEENKPSVASSLIRFHGQSILPPLLSGERREEMQRHRDAAHKLVRTRFKDNQRMAYVQTILHSVQLRNTPTLEELLQESEINTKSSYSHNTSGGSHSNFSIGTKDSLLLSSPTTREGDDGFSFPLLSSTTVTPQQNYQEGCLIDQHNSQEPSQPCLLNGASMVSVSSDYVTYENVENTTSVSEKIYLGRENHGFSSTEEAGDMGGFFLHNTSNTIAKMPDIISHPPIDGEELERSGVESSFCNDFIAVKDICCSSVQQDSVICDYLPEEKSENNHLDSTESEDDLPSTAVLDFDKDGNLDRTEVPVSSLDNSCFSDNPELSQTSNTPHCPTAELHIQHSSGETEPGDDRSDETDSKPYEEPYRLSLQALLKKSQEYRRRQRMLRNQARNTKIQERAQEQPRIEEQSLSDKENDEFPYKRTVPTEEKKTKEKRGTFIPSMETSLKKSWENERLNESELTGKRVNCKLESTHLTGDGNMKEMTSVEEETTLINNKLNISQEAFQKQPESSETSPVQASFYSTGEKSVGLGKFYTIPAINFCRSPVHSRGKGIIENGEAETSKGKILANTSLNEEEEEVNFGHQNCQSTVVHQVVEGDVTSVLAKSSQHIDQLESNLSSLKVLISDLEYTLTENQENHIQTENNHHSGDCFEGITHTEQTEDDKHMQLSPSDCDYWENKQCDDGDNSDAEQYQVYRKWPRRQLFNNCKNIHEDSGPEPSISDTDDIPLIVEDERKDVVKLTELRLVQTLTTERQKEKAGGKEGLTKSCPQQQGAHRKQQPKAKCILSVAQRMRIPDVFRNAPSETPVTCNVSVLLDTSNHQAEKRNELAVGGHESNHSLSLNQSYDVDTPSGLWLVKGSGSDLGSEGRHVQEKNLTPESGGEGQGEISKVKRRLLMHLKEEILDRSADTSRGVGSDVRPDSSTPRAAVRWCEVHGDHKNKQEQLKQAHAAQVKALQEEHRRQQEELLQALAERYRLLQSVSLPCSMSSSRLGDTMTFSTPSQPSSSLPERCRPLLVAAVKGFLTRRLLRTDRVVQLVRTVGDTQRFLQAFQQQSPGRGELCSRQDLLLQERVTLQLRAARYELYDIFFSLSAAERMQLISWDRELARERELRRQSGHTHQPRGKSSLSAATQKSLERKRGVMIQKKAAERHGGAVTRTGLKTGFSADQPLETKRGQFRANPQRVPKSTYSSRPR